MPPVATPAIDRVLAKVVAGPNCCWIWTGNSLRKGGYGQIWDNDAKGIRVVHRVTYEHFVGPVPDGLQLDHICRVRRCVNPKHLEAVTPRENQLRSPVSPSAVNARKTHCKHGHEFTPENTGRKKRDGSRYCKECYRRSAHEQYWKNHVRG